MCEDKWWKTGAAVIEGQCVCSSTAVSLAWTLNCSHSDHTHISKTKDLIPGNLLLIHVHHDPLSPAATDATLGPNASPNQATLITAASHVEIRPCINIINSHIGISSYLISS